MNTKTAYHWLPSTRVLSGTSSAFESPREPGVWYPPMDATFDVPPDDVPEGSRLVRSVDNTAWVIEPIPVPPVVPAPAPPALTPEERQRALDQAIQRRLDEYARAWGYNGMDRAISYMSSTNLKWHAEAVELNIWRDATWSVALAIQNACLAAEREIPTEAELMAELPPAPPRPATPA